MTREKENELLERRRQLRIKAQEMIQRIVEARIRGGRDEDAIQTLAKLSREEVDMTSPDFTLAA